MSGRGLVVAVSPHLDDAVFSAGAALAGLAADGWRVRVVTTFTRTVPDPTGFALACQTDKGLGPEVDYMALRRAEDVAAMEALGVDAPVHLGFAEAPHRGYESGPELFAGVHADDDAAAALVPALDRELEGADVVLAPVGLGGHVDHLVVIAALGDRPVVRWDDLPYALRAGPHERSRPAATAPVAIARKLDACAAYASQLGFQFGGEDAMRRALVGVPERFGGALPTVHG